MKILKNIKAIKSTILGIVLIAAGLYTMVKVQGYNVYLVGFLIVSGIGLFFCPDRYINALEKLVLGREIKLNNDKKDESEEA